MNAVFDIIRRGDVFFADLGEPFGSELGYRRPVLVIQRNDTIPQSEKVIVALNIDFQPSHNGLSYTKKKDMLDALLTKLSYRDLAVYVDVSRKSFCDKFSITVDEFKRLVEKGLIHKTNDYLSVKNLLDGDAKWSSWSGYDVYDYFELTRDMIEEALRE